MLAQGALAADSHTSKEGSLGFLADTPDKVGEEEVANIKGLGKWKEKRLTYIGLEFTGWRTTWGARVGVSGTTSENKRVQYENWDEDTLQAESYHKLSLLTVKGPLLSWSLSYSNLTQVPGQHAPYTPWGAAPIESAESHMNNGVENQARWLLLLCFKAGPLRQHRVKVQYGLHWAIAGSKLDPQRPRQLALWECVGDMRMNTRPWETASSSFSSGIASKWGIALASIGCPGLIWCSPFTITAIDKTQMFKQCIAPASAAMSCPWQVSAHLLWLENGSQPLILKVISMLLSMPNCSAAKQHLGIDLTLKKPFFSSPWFPKLPSMDPRCGQG